MKCTCGHTEKKHHGTLVVWQPKHDGDRTHYTGTCQDLRCDCRKFLPPVETSKRITCATKA
jgi:hypothetical protein